MDDKPDIVVLHVGSNNIHDKVNPEILAKDIMNIGKKCIAHGVSEVYISEILKRKSMILKGKIVQVYNILSAMCEENDFYFVRNSNITSEYLWRDGLHLQDSGTEILSYNTTSVLNRRFIQNSMHNNYI